MPSSLGEIDKWMEDIPFMSGGFKELNCRIWGIATSESRLKGFVLISFFFTWTEEVFLVKRFSFIDFISSMGCLRGWASSYFLSYMFSILSSLFPSLAFSWLVVGAVWYTSILLVHSSDSLLWFLSNWKRKTSSSCCGFFFLLLISM